jgi:hypothetical protein
MTLHTWIRKLTNPLRRCGAAKGRSGRGRGRQRRAPSFEVLEDRLVPSTLTVTDTSDNPADSGSLRYAISQLGSGSNTINFASNLAGQTITLTHGQLEIDHDVTITGPTNRALQQVTISGNTQTRIFFIPVATVEIVNLTLAVGSANNSSGGAIFNGGKLTLLQSTVRDSTCTGGDGIKPNSSFSEGAGGGIFNDGTLNVMQCTISGNTANGGSGGDGESGGGGGAGMGGGIFNEGTLNLVDSTVSGNTAVGGAGGTATQIHGSASFVGGYGGGYGGYYAYYVGRDAGMGGGGHGGVSVGIVDSNDAGQDAAFGGGGGGGGAYVGPGDLGVSLAHGGSGGAYGGAGGAGGNASNQSSSGGAFGGGGGGGAGIGGGIFNWGNVTITCSTIADNSATGGAGGPSNGEAVAADHADGQPGMGVAGGIFLYQSNASLDSTIIAGNTAGGPGGGLSPDARVFVTPGSLLGGATPSGTFSGAYNLVQNTTGLNGLTATDHNLLGVDAHLGSLDYYRSVNRTMPLGSNGPAIGAGDPEAVNPIDGTLVFYDERGVVRQLKPDIGAYEVGGKPPGHPKITATVSTATTGITYGVAYQVTLTGSVVTFKDNVRLSGGIHETGTLTFTLFHSGSQVYTTSDAVRGNGIYSASYVLPTATKATGSYQWDLSYSGDPLNKPATDNNSFSQAVAIYSAKPTLRTTMNSTTTIPLGGEPVPVLQDEAQLSGSYRASGSITFSLYFNGAAKPVYAQSVSVNGDGIYATPGGYTLPTGGTVPGTYQWDVSYSGDSNNHGAAVNNAASQRVTVSAATPSLRAVPNAAALTLGSTPPTLTDTASLTGGYHASGSISFSLFYNGGAKPVYTNTVTLNGDGNYLSGGYTLPATGSVAGTYQWDVRYSGDGNNQAVSELGNAAEIVVVSVPPVLFVDLTNVGLPPSTYGTPSAAASFAVTGKNLTQSASITAPAGAQVSLDGATWSTSVTLAPRNGTLAHTTIEVRTSAAANAGGINGNVVVASSGLVQQVQVDAAVLPVRLTASIVGDPTRQYDGTTALIVTSADLQLSGLVNGDSFVVKSILGSYNSKDVVTATTVTVNLSPGEFMPAAGSRAANYILPTSASGPGQIQARRIPYRIGSDVQDAGHPANLAHDLPAAISTGVGGETLTITYSSAGDTATAVPGPYAINGVIADGSGRASDYAVTLFPGTLTVNPPLQLSAATLPAGFVNLPYQMIIAAGGGTRPITYAPTGGSLPPGLQLAADGTITGTALAAGTYEFTISTTDSFGEIVRAPFELKVNPLF